MATTHAAALEYLREWYEDKHGRTAPNFHDLMSEAQVVSDFLELDSPITVVVLRVGAVTRQDGKTASAPLPTKGKIMQLRDDEQFTLTLEAKDAKGFDVSGDAFTATSADTTVATVTGPDDSGTFTVVAGDPGSTVITLSDANGITATEAVDVVAGDVATVTINEGPVEPQTAAPAPVTPTP